MTGNGRRFEPEAGVRSRRRDDGRIELLAPGPGLWRSAPSNGALLGAGEALGELEVLGVLHRLRVPADAYGVVIELPDGRRLARRPVDAGAVLVVLDPSGASGVLDVGGPAETRAASGGPVFKTPLGGRYYARPGPTADPFVKVGDEVKAGTTVALIEVMKTFNRVSYAGPPARARVKAIVRADGDDVEAGDVLLELEAVD